MQIVGAGTGRRIIVVVSSSKSLLLLMPVGMWEKASLVTIEMAQPERCG
jgi:hypothetical protein